MADTSRERLEVIRRTFEHGPNPNGPQSFAPGPVFAAMGDLLAMIEERDAALGAAVAEAGKLRRVLRLWTATGDDGYREQSVADAARGYVIRSGNGDLAERIRITEQVSAAALGGAESERGT